MTGLYIPPPRLVVLGRSLPEQEGSLRDSLSSLLGSKVRRVDVEGPCPYPYPADLLLSWTVLGIDGHGQLMEDLITGPIGRCGLYVGIRSPEGDSYQLGERGFDLAGKHHIPAVLLDTYDSRAIFDFVQNRSYARS